MREQYNDLTAKKIGSRLRQIREGRGLTQKEVADEAQITEVSLSRYENGERVPKITVFFKICNVLWVSMDSVIEYCMKN